MVKTTQLRAARKFGPGYFIREQMDLRNWTQEDMADIMGVSVKHINKILNNSQPLTLDISKILGEIFDTSPHYWINIDTGYRLWKTQEKSEKELAADVKGIIYERMPVNDMVKKGWLKPFKDVYNLKEQVLDFWDWKELDFSALDKQLPCLTRRSSAYNQYNASYALTWYRMAQKTAEKKKVAKYDPVKLKTLATKLHKYSIMENGENKFIKELYKCGVIFFVLPHLLKTYLDGAAFYSGNNPVIVYTARYHRTDNFWFTLAHEIAHILKHLKTKSEFILDDFTSKESDKLEDEANALASEYLLHNKFVPYLEPYMNYLSTEKVEKCSEKYEIHPAIIVGKLAHDGKVSYANQKLYNENVLESIDTRYQNLFK